jgi:hypothetical protein
VRARPRHAAVRRTARRWESVEDSFAAVMEFSVALAGFAGVAIALSVEPGALAPLDRFRALNLLSNALGAGFGASFVLIGNAFALTGPVLWQRAGMGVFVVVILCMALPVYQKRQLAAADRSRLSSGLWVLLLGGHTVLAVTQLANIAGLFGPPNPGPIMVSLIWLLFFSSLLFVRMLVSRPTSPTV